MKGTTSLSDLVEPNRGAVCREAEVVDLGEGFGWKVLEGHM